MNEVTKIHLGRQAFTISVDAHHELRGYLDAIKKQVEDSDVLEEIEMRMAELLGERGIDSNKVILIGDVDFLKEQLGKPKDFREDDEDEAASQKALDSRRLFRDTENALIAGVSAGLAKYLGFDVLLVRILFIILTIATAGWAILLYIVLWLLVPEAKTSSDRLLMAGKPVTVDSLKEIVERADVKGAVHRVNAPLVSFVNSVFRVVLKVIGLAFILTGLIALFGLVAAESYILLHHGSLIQNNIFPVGFREHLLLDIAMLVVALFALFIMLSGIAVFRRKWPIRSWVTGILVGLLFLGLAVGGGLTTVVYPNVRDRYNENTHTIVRNSQPFTNVSVFGGDGVGINFETSNKYYVSLNYYGHPNVALIKTYVKNGTLFIDTSQFNWHRSCTAICIPNTYNMNITVFTPNALQIMNQGFSYPAVPVKPVPNFND